MLMVDGVELAAIDQALEMMELEGRDAVRLEQNGEAANEVVDVRHMREHVVRGHEVGLAAVARKLPGQLDTEESLDDRDPPLPRRSGGAGGRLDAGAGDAARLHVLQQVPVI